MNANAIATSAATSAPNPTQQSRRLPLSAPLFASIALIALIASAVAIAALAQWTDIDLWLADLYYDPVRRVFPWDNTWFARDFMHGYLKQVIVWFGFLTIAAMLIDLVYPLFRKSPLRRLQWRFVALASILEPLLVRTLKASSNLHCPVGIDLYGGRAPLLRLFDAVPLDWHAGHCFPAGHASAGFAFFGGYFVLRDAAPRAARIWLVATLVVGLVLGISQQARGAHFMSHTLWTAWLCWTIAWLCDGAATHLRLRYQAHPATPEARHVAS